MCIGLHHQYILAFVLLSTHGNLIEKIQNYCKDTNQYVPETVGETVRCVYESLALKYRFALEQISECIGNSFERLHLLGGGTKDNFLCEMTADCIDMPVIAGPIEATATGNMISQLIYNNKDINLKQARELIVKSFDIKEV